MRRLQPAGLKRQAREALSTPQHTWCLGFLPGGWAHPSTHVALGLPAWGLGTSQHTRGA